MFNFRSFINTYLIPFETSTEESKKVEIDNKAYTLYRCDKDDYLAMFSPKVVERIGNYYLIIDEVEEEWVGDYFIQSPSGNLYYLSLTL